MLWDEEIRNQRKNKRNRNKIKCKVGKYKIYKIVINIYLTIFYRESKMKMKMNENDLQNVENYNKIIFDNEDEIYSRYTNIIIQYLLLGTEKIKNHNAEYVKYILIKGLFTISYVFKMLFMYSCNLQLTYHHCQKSYSYYIEFIGQIGDDAVTYLQLNSKDAALFVYKKTIFDISDEIKKKYTENDANEKKNKNISIMIDIYNKLIETEIMNLSAEQLKNTEFINRIYTSVGRVNSKLCKLYYCCSNGDSEATIEGMGGGDKNDNESNKTNIFFKKIVYIKNFCDIIVLKKTASNSNATSADNCNGVDYYKDYIKLIEYYIKKIRKINHLPNDFELELVSKSFSEQFEEKIRSHNVSKVINWIFSSH
jgi:hypothetical protein